MRFQREEQRLLWTTGVRNIHKNQIFCCQYPKNLSEVDTKINGLICLMKEMCGQHTFQKENGEIRANISGIEISTIKQKPGMLHCDNRKMFLQGQHTEADTSVVQDARDTARAGSSTGKCLPCGTDFEEQCKIGDRGLCQANYGIFFKFSCVDFLTYKVFVNL